MTVFPRVVRGLTEGRVEDIMWIFCPAWRGHFYMNNTSDKSTGRLVAGYLAEMIRVVVISLAIILPIRYFLIQPFYVKGASMEPNFYDHEYLIIDELSYRFREPERGDIVVFRYPRDPRQYFIKRVIGLPGETVVVSRGQVTVINGENFAGLALDESDYLSDGVFTAGDKRVTLLAGEYYLLGDNRASSLDSRIFGPVSRELIVGRVWVRGWPIDKLSIFETPLYQDDSGKLRPEPR